MLVNSPRNSRNYTDIKKNRKRWRVSGYFLWSSHFVKINSTIL